MNYLNNAALIKRQLLVRFAKIVLDGTTEENIDMLPIQQTSGNYVPVRCCIHHDRMVLRHRLAALLGFEVENITDADSVRPLSDLVKKAEELGDSRFSDKILTVIDDACNSCIRAKYRVTNACRGCVARPCIVNCPRKAITMVNGQAVIDENLCVSCGLCMKVCPYHSIIYQPIPCEESCPVGAISQDVNRKEKIDENKCVHCGKCQQACPFGAIVERSAVFDILRAVKKPETKTVALVAPSIVGQFNTSLDKVVGALKKLGFDHVVEVAYGADLTAAHEAEEFVERIGGGAVCMTSSCCPAYVQVVKKHIPEIASLVSSTPSPMIFAGEWATKQWPGAKRVFIGPCVAKRSEARTTEFIDYVMTYEELGSILIAADINVGECDGAEPDRDASTVGRKFAINGGVSEAVFNAAAAKGITAEQKPVNGLDKKSISGLKVLGKVIKVPTFVEVMNCEGGCVNGPGVISNPAVSRRFIEALVKK